MSLKDGANMLKEIIEKIIGGKMSKRKDKENMPKEDVKFLDGIVDKFKELGLELEYETSYSGGSGSYDFFFKNGGPTFRDLQFMWCNEKYYKTELAEYEPEFEMGVYKAFGFYDEDGCELIPGGVTNDVYEILDWVVEKLPSGTYYEMDTVEGLHAFLSKLIEEGKGDYKVEDMKYENLTGGHVKAFDDDKVLKIDCRLYDGAFEGDF